MMKNGGPLKSTEKSCFRQAPKGILTGPAPLPLGCSTNKDSLLNYPLENQLNSLSGQKWKVHSFLSQLPKRREKSKTEHCSLLNTVHLWLEYKKREIRDLDLEENSPGFLLWLHIRKRGFYISDSIVSLVVYRVKSRVITPIQKPEHFISSLMLSFFPAEQLLLHCNL